MASEQEYAERFLFSLSSLAEIGEAIYSNRRDFSESLQWLLEMTLGSMRMGRGAILLYDPQKRCLSFAAGRGIESPVEELTLEASELAYLRQHRIVSADAFSAALEGFANRHAEVLAALRVETWVALNVPDRFLGVMGLGPVFTGEPLTRWDQDFLLVLTHHISLAIYSSQLIQEMRQANFQLRWQMQRLLTLSEVSAEITSVLDPEPLMPRILESAIMLLDARSGGLVLVEEGRLVPRAHWGSVQLDAERLQGSLVEQAMQGAQTVSAARDAQAERFGVSSVAVAPIRSQETTFGALVVCDKESREGQILEFDEGDRALLTGLANQAGVAIENARLYQDALLLRQMEAEMLAAAEIQRRLLPMEAPEIPGYDLAGVSIPRGRVGGDYYDFLVEDTQHLGLVIADVSGKGTQAALLMATLRAGVLFESGNPDLTEMVLRLNDLLYRSTPQDKYATFFYARLAWQTHQLTAINAGHNPPLLFRQNGEVESLEATGTLLGAFPNDILPHIGDYQSQSLILHPGDLLLLYTDGVTEAHNVQDEQFGVERLCEVVNDCRELSAAAILQRIQGAVDAFQGAVEPFDDFTLVVLKRTD